MDGIKKCKKLEITFRNKKQEEIREAFNNSANKNYIQKQLKIDWII